MLSLLRHTTFRMLFAAQVVALLGTGLATVALALLAFDLAGDDAGLVLGTALAIKMIAYVGVAPLAGAYGGLVPRRTLLVSLDAVRVAVALALPFVDQIWQIYVLIFVLQSASAAFTPTFQAAIPDILDDERDYTKALSLSRLAYDLESLVSPVLAAALLAFVGFHWLFAGTSAGFAASAAFVLWSAVPPAAPADSGDPFLARATRGVRRYLATPRLRGLLALNLAAAAGGAMVIVNTVVYVRSVLGGSAADVAAALAVFGAGSMVAALALPRSLETIADRGAMLAGGLTIGAALLAMAAVSLAGYEGWIVFLAVWLVLGLGYSCVLTPSGRLLRRSATARERPELFAAQFALSHACWLLTYPLAGWLGSRAGLGIAFLLFGALALAGTALAARLWPREEAEPVAHTHTDLPPDHPHVRDAHPTPHGLRHAHGYVIDEFHPRWPIQG